MKLKVGVTQRVESIAGRDETRDALDQAWTALIEQCGYGIVPIPNCLTDPASWCAEMGIGRLIFSGGADWGAQPARDQTEERLWKWSLDARIPLLGVCRGMQVMNQLAGGRLAPVDGHVAVSHPLEILSSAHAFDRSVNSFHAWGIPQDGIAAGYRALARTQDFVEALECTERRHLGIMWHPEREPRLSPANVKLIQEHFR